MASENTIKNKITEMGAKQKLMLVVMLIVVIIIVWQIRSLFGDGSSAVTEIKPAVNTLENSKISDTNSSGTAGLAAAKAPTALKSGTDNLTPGVIVNDALINSAERINEEKHIKKLTELEELKIQRQIAETNQAIAAAKLATVTSERDIGDLLTKPAASASSYNTDTFPSSPPAASVDVTPQGMTGAASGAPADNSTPPAASLVIPPKVQEVLPYVLTSVSLVYNKWNALLQLQNMIYSVGVGDTLPPDGSVVTNINKNSVTLKKDGKSRKVSISTSI